MSEEVEFEITLASEWHQRSPHVKIFIDSTLIEECNVDPRITDKEHLKINWKGALEEGDHLIRIQMLDKTHVETVIHSDGVTILKDQLLHVESISIDQIDLGFLVYKLGKFYPDKNLRPDLDDVIPNLTCIGYNGEWQLKFSVPTYLWLLENF
jgi:hypothetical protein